MAPSITMNRQSYYLKLLSCYSAAIYIRMAIPRCIKHETLCWRNSTRFSHIKPLLTPHRIQIFFLGKSYHKIDLAWTKKIMAVEGAEHGWQLRRLCRQSQRKRDVQIIWR